MNIDKWDGKLEETAIEVEGEQVETQVGTDEEFRLSEDKEEFCYDEPDRTDYYIAASCGVLAGILDSFWVGSFSLPKAQDWGREQVNQFVIKVAKMRGYRKNELGGAIRFLEKDAPIPSDQLTSIWGGGLQHHFRDFAHHASVGGLVFSVLSQFTGKSYGTNTNGDFELHEFYEKQLIGNTFEEKLYNGIVVWALHLISDMAGSSSNAGKGTGIPGPILSLLKELSVLPGVRNVCVNYKDSDIPLSVMLSKVFNGTAFHHTGPQDLIRFDLRTELGVYAYGGKQSIPVVINQCAIRAFYFIKRFCLEIGRAKIQKICDISTIDPRRFFPYNNKCVIRMSTVSSGIFCAVDTFDAAIRSFLKKPNNITQFISQYLLRTNFVGIGVFVISIKNDIAASLLEKSHSEMVLGADMDNESLAAENIEIEIDAQIDSKSLYKCAFDRMLNQVKSAKDNFQAAQIGCNTIGRALLRIEDDETELYSKVAEVSNQSLLVETGTLIKRLFALYAVEYTSLPDKALTDEHMPFCRVENGRRIGYKLSTRVLPRISQKEITEIGELYNLDGIKVVALAEPGADTDLRNVLAEDETRRSKGFVQYVTIADMFALLPSEEFPTYLSYVDRFIRDVRKLIGYRTIVVPSQDSLRALKEAFISDIMPDAFREELLEAGVDDDQIGIISKNYWDRELYRALFGNAPFADSLISSEWYYKTHKSFSTLEQTAIIAGYLKSIEQLLYTIVQFSEGTGKTIKRKGFGGPVYIEYSSENKDAIDISLGSLIGYVGYARHHSDLWAVSRPTKEFVIGKLRLFRDKYRNDHFHKDNIYSEEEIEEIRKNTLLLCYLLLGGMFIKDNEKEKLGIAEKQTYPVMENLTYKDLEKWLDRILGGDVLLPTSTKVFFCLGMSGQEKYRLDFTTVSGYSDEGIPEGMKWPYICDDISGIEY